ncbi:hypothetical protein [Chryseobacterium gambrini]|uniref:Uncharacterized protein n=1 Tax=Chryseobacterium gambrini TaxID=373672 RepID=A0A1N7QVF0_9FLAO|nr:hypothetical protein [Chryseobacterium gambrini]SIT26407.1 hypothetical protein SAMN05421785_11829 [Chryseobacterium gambrini]
MNRNGLQPVFQKRTANSALAKIKDHTGFKKANSNLQQIDYQ